MRTTVGPAIILGLGLVTISCTGGDDDPAGAASTAPATPVETTEPVDEPATTEPATTTMAAATTTLPPPPAGERIEITGFPDELDVSSASDLLPAQRGRGHMLVGMTRVPGTPAVPAAWDSADGINWDPAPAPAPPGGGTASVSAAAHAADGLAFAGSQVADGGLQEAAVWIAADDRTFSTAAELPAAGRRSSIEAVTDSAAGLVAAGWVEDDGVRSPFVGVRAPSGGWTEATVPELPQFNVWDVAATDATVVIVGNDASATPHQAMALVSTDGGATFVYADTRQFAGEVATNLGAVEVTPSGFLALACAPTPTGTVIALARSADGSAWTRQDIGLESEDIDLAGGSCDSLTVEGDVAHIGYDRARTFVVTVQPDGRATAVQIPQRPRQAAERSPLLVALGGGQLLAVSRDDGGFSGATLPAGVSATGLPFGAPSVQSLDVTRTGAGIAVRAQLFPQHSGIPGGAESWGPYHRWFAGGDGAPITFDPTAPETLELVIQAPFGDVGVAGVDGDGEDEAATYRGAVEGFVRAPAGNWESAGVVVSGPASENLLDLVVTPTGTVVGVGYTLGFDEASGTTFDPLVRSTVDGATWAVETISGEVPAGTVLQSVCVRPDGVVDAWGALLGGDSSRAVHVRRATDGSWSVIPSDGLTADGVTCTTTDSGRSILRLAGPASSTILVSDDGLEFTPADVSAIAITDYDVAEITEVSGLLLGVGGVETDAGLDPLVITSDDEGTTWQTADVEGITGLGDQQADGVIAQLDGSVLVVGTDNGAPVAWVVRDLA